MKRRELLKSFGAVTAASALPISGARALEPSSATARPNILIFLTDDHGQWLQQAYGNWEVHTPNMSRIAREGIRMGNAFTTCPVCSPARASFFTGRMPSQHGIHDWIEEKKYAYAYPWLKGQTLLPQLLQTTGYHTALVGKWHCGAEREPHPGFDRWFSYWESQYPHTGSQRFSDDGKLVTVDGFQSPMLTDQAIRFLHSHYADPSTQAKPFFLFVGYTDTHSPHADMPSDIVARYKDATFRDIPGEPFAPVHGRTVNPISDNPLVERKKREQYYSAASSIDREVGRVLDELQSRGQLENTLIVYTGDHGLNAGHHGIWEKGNATVPQNFLEESIRIPCTLSWPKGGIPKGLTSDLCVNHCDLFTTLLEAAQATPSTALAHQINSPGRSYLSHLRGDSVAQSRDIVFCEYGNARMIRADGYKLIARYPFRGVRFPNELYDLKADPRETTNLFDRPEHAALIEHLTTQLNQFFATYTVPENDGMNLERLPPATPASPWVVALQP
ncbi:MAG TPA: sulfatase-like hydrolase/transferase [Edaphobacter sp.]